VGVTGTLTVSRLVVTEVLSTTMIDAHVLNRGPNAVRSPADRMFSP